MQTQQNEEPEYFVVPLEAQVAMSTFLYAKWQENVIKRLDKYLTFPQWLMTLDNQPQQLGIDDLNMDAPDIIESYPFRFIKFEWLPIQEWGFEAVLTTSNDCCIFDLCLGFFTLIWISTNDNIIK